MRFHFNLFKFRRNSAGYLIIYLIAIFISLKIGYVILSLFGYNKKIYSQSTSNLKFQSCPVPVYFNNLRYPKNAVLLKNLQCPMVDDLVIIKEDLVYLIKQKSCSFECISWKSDFDYKLSEKMNLTHSQPVPCPYFVVSCNDSTTRQFIFHSIRSEKLINQSYSIIRNKPKPSDVMIIGIDSLSYHAFKYYLPSTFAALQNDLNGVSFGKFNTMGDGTTVNLQSFLTGLKDTESYEARRRIKDSKSVDKFNWIWNHFKDKGYVTLYGEEMTDFGTFQYRLKGFENQPTDVYLRTPIMFAERTGIYKKFCFGNKPLYSEYFRFLQTFQKAYADVPKFSFIFFGHMTHDGNKYISYMDEELSRFIIDFRAHNPDAYIILYSDHGHRFTSRLTMEGKYEERLPFLGMSLPESKNHLKSILSTNSEILISGFDLHATLEDIIGIYNPIGSRSRHMSLLRPLPNDRTCGDIESLPHWCACLNWKSIENPNLNKTLVKAAQMISERISQFTLEDRYLCHELKLNRILSVYGLDANTDVLKFKQSADVDGFVPDLSDQVRQTTHWFRFGVQTMPGDAIFEVTILIQGTDLKNYSNLVSEFKPEDVSRLNKFAPWITCLAQRKGVYAKISDIRKFCICKNIT